MEATNQPAYIVYVSDSLGPATEVSYHRTITSARKRFAILDRTLVRNGHNAVMLGRACPRTGIYLNVSSS